MKFLTAEASAGIAATDAQGNPIYKDGAPVTPYLNGADEMIYSLSKRYEDSPACRKWRPSSAKAPTTSSSPSRVQPILSPCCSGVACNKCTKVVPRDVVESEFNELARLRLRPTSHAVSHAKI